ncbi:MAG: hypothetical protein U9M90_03965 [Patescibacteria group bacterium]|nr:hypothetical protein [Patescibacteria group bacterium]
MKELVDIKPKALKAIFLIILVGWCGFFLAKKINLANSDIGRHIKNGELLVTGDKNIRQKVLHTNFYSYTNPDYPFVNHHWGAGVLFYLTWKQAGFTGLSLLYIGLCLIGFLLVFFIAWKESSFWLAYAIAIIAAPLIGLRSEIRPEMITYVFGPLLFWILLYYRKGRISYTWLFILPVLLAVWININTYFIFGLYLIGIFWIETVIACMRAKGKKDKKKEQLYYEKAVFLCLSGILSFFAVMLNPWGIKGVFYPFVINSQIEFSVLELSSPFLLKATGELPPGFESYFFLLGAMSVAFALLIFKPFRKKFSPVVFIWGLTLCVLSIFQARNVAFFSLFAIPLLAMTYKAVWVVVIELSRAQQSYLAFLLLNKRFLNLSKMIIIPFLFALMVAFNSYFVFDYNNTRGIGFCDNVIDALEYFKDQDISGRIFNDFDISSYLIFGLYPNEKIFVDHRPEAYPAGFFNNVLHSAITNERSWGEIEKKYDINSIFLTNKPSYSKINLFVNRRIQDPEWELRYSDKYAYILAKIPK